MNDKIQRIKTFVKKGVLQNESLEDSFLDLANYAMLGLALYRESQETVIEDCARPYAALIVTGKQMF